MSEKAALSQTNNIVLQSPSRNFSCGIILPAISYNFFYFISVYFRRREITLLFYESRRRHHVTRQVSQWPSSEIMSGTWGTLFVIDIVELWGELKKNQHKPMSITRFFIEDMFELVLHDDKFFKWSGTLFRDT